MTIQFRTRTKSTINYSPELKSTGVCCDPLGEKSQKTFLECFQSGGNFYYGLIDEINCPTVGATGCCCSCSANNFDETEVYSTPPNYECDKPISLSTKGLTDNVTECECNRIGGKWTEGKCPSSSTFINEAEAISFCLKQYEPGTIRETTCNFDVRVPRSCCYIYTDELNIPIGITCSNVCTEQDCESLSFSSYSSVYSPGKLCNGNLIPENNQANCASPSIAALMVTKTENETNEPYGSCFETIKQNNGYTFSVSYTTEKKCKDGYWIETQGDLKIYDHLLKPSLPVKEGIRLIEPEQMSSIEFDSLNLSIGDFYKGGIYIGIYDLGSPISNLSSKLFVGRSENNKNIKIIKSTSNGSGNKNNERWVLLVEPQIYTTTFLEFNEPLNINFSKISLYDGFYNCYGNNLDFYGIKSLLINSITGKNRKGFIDFYIPSIFELEFFTNQYYSNDKLRDIILPSKLPCMSSSLRTNNLIYSQYLNYGDFANFGAEIIAGLNQKLSLFFFRRIILT
jgi:hypothetical protein